MATKAPTLARRMIANNVDQNVIDESRRICFFSVFPSPIAAFPDPIVRIQPTYSYIHRKHLLNMTNDHIGYYFFFPFFSNESSDDVWGLREIIFIYY